MNGSSLAIIIAAAGGLAVAVQAQLMGLMQTSAEEWEAAKRGGLDVDEATIAAAIAERLAARAAKDFATSDRIRDELAAKGIQLKDGKDPDTGEAITNWEIRRT